MLNPVVNLTGQCRRWVAKSFAEIGMMPLGFLALLTLLGFTLRALGLDFGLPNDSRPDEIPIMRIVLENILSQLMMAGDFSLHPHFLNYPSLYFYLMSGVFLLFYAVGHMLGWFPDWQAFLMSYEWDHTVFHLILRSFSVLMGTLMIPAMFFLARYWSGSMTVAWLSAALTTTNYLLVRNSHFGSVDILLTLGITVSLWGILSYMRQRTERRLRWACVLCGLTVGVKYPAVLLLLSLAVAILQPFVDARRIDWFGFLHAVWKPIGLAMLVFFLTSPWILLDFPRFLHDIHYESANFFTFRMPDIATGWVFYPVFTLPYGMGGVVLVFSLAGILLRWRQSPSRWEEGMLLIFMLATFVLLGFNNRVMTRYALPMIPVLILYAAYGIRFTAELLVKATQSKLRRQSFVSWREPKAAFAMAALLLLVLWQPVALSVGFNRLMMQPDTRTLARNWIINNIPSQTPVATGPRLGQIYLPGDYGQLVVQNGPQAMDKPSEVHIQEATPRTRLIDGYHDLALLKKLGIRYVVTFEGFPMFSNRPWELEPLAKIARVVHAVTPLKPNMTAKDVGNLDPMDAFFLPYDDFSAFERPGPLILIYDLLQPPARPVE